MTAPQTDAERLAERATKIADSIENSAIPASRQEAAKVMRALLESHAAREREVVRLREALKWALPLAEIATEDNRIKRMLAGYNDITGAYKNGRTWVGIYQSEVDEIENARALLTGASHA